MLLVGLSEWFSACVDTEESSSYNVGGTEQSKKKKKIKKVKTKRKQRAAK